MRIKREEIDMAIDVLSKEFWKGKRWISFPISDSFIDFRFIKFFVRVDWANRCCFKSSRRGRQYRFKALADFLKQLNKHSTFRARNKIGFKAKCATSKFGCLNGEYFTARWKGNTVLILRFNLKTCLFECFDGKLKRVRPSRSCSLKELNYFGFREKIYLV